MELMQFLTNHGAELLCLGLKTRDATDTLEAVTLGQLIQFLDRGTQLVLPHRRHWLQPQGKCPG